MNAPALKLPPRRIGRQLPIEKWDTRETTLECGAAVLHLRSFNRKLGPVEMVETHTRPRPVAMPPYVASTYLPIRQTCPSSCAFKGAGCYASEGWTRFQVERLEKAAVDARLDADGVIRCEADLIARTPRLVGRDRMAGRDLRLHISGDVSTPAQAEELAAAAKTWREDGGGSIWTYTHAWRDVDRAAWGPAISVLASIERADEADAALRRGYAPAIVVDEFPIRLNRGWSERDAVMTPAGEERGGDRDEKPPSKAPPPKKKRARKANGSGHAMKGASGPIEADGAVSTGTFADMICSVLETVGYRARWVASTPKGHVFIVEEG